jgi:acetylornithine deacetylase
MEHPLVQAAMRIGCAAYVSPTTSDIAVLPCPALKIGAGNSARSHTADEFVYIHEIEESIIKYNELIGSIREL